MTLATRRALVDDRPAIAQLWLAAWTALMPEIDFAARIPWLNDRLDAVERDGGEILVVAEDTQVRGFVTVDPATRYLDQLASDVQAQRRGFARHLLRAAKARSPGGLTLKVNQANAPAIALYRAEGFVVTGESVGSTSGLPLYDMHWPGQVAG